MIYVCNESIISISKHDPKLEVRTVANNDNHEKYKLDEARRKQKPKQQQQKPMEEYSAVPVEHNH